MRWFAGWHPASTEAGHPSVPVGARQVWSGGPLLWVAGQWDRWEVRTCQIPGCHLAVFGACLATDTELAAAATAVRRSGNYTVLAELAGNHVTVVHDEYGVTVITDLAGLHPVFYTPWTGGTLFASSPLPLADLTRAGPDLEWLAAMLLCPDVPQANVDRSAFAGIRRTRPGHVLTVGPDGLRQRPIPLPLGGATFDEGAQALRSALVTAVQRRADLGQTMTADFSGGLDSSTLAVLAARYLPAALPAITYADPVADNADDLAYAKLCADDEPGLHQIIVTGDQTTLPFLDLDQVPLLDEPSQDALLFARTRVRFAPAAARGSAIHLSGDGGDAVLVGPLTYLADLARSGRMCDVVREAATWARLRHRPAHTLLRKTFRLARTGYPAAILNVARQLRNGTSPERRGTEGHLVWCAASPSATWATVEARRSLADRLEEAAETIRDQRWQATADGTALRDVHWNGASSHSFEQLVHELGVKVHVPFLDNQVVTACMSVPVADRTTAAHAKPLLAAALDGLVPARLLGRPTKGDYTACLYAGLQQAAPHLRELLTDPLLAKLGLIEADTLQVGLDQATSGLAFPVAALGDVITTEQWLRTLRRPRPRLWATGHTKDHDAHAAAP